MKDASLWADVMVAMVTILQDGLQMIPTFGHLQAILSLFTTNTGWLGHGMWGNDQCAIQGAVMKGCSTLLSLAEASCHLGRKLKQPHGS